MAQLIHLKKVIDQKLEVLFDTNILINCFKGSPDSELITGIALNKRFITELVAWQFFHPSNVAREEIQERRKWLSSKRIEFRKNIPSGYLQTFFSLLYRPDAKGDAVDAALSAYTISSGDTCVVATHDASNFCWHDNIYIIKDFLPSGSCV